MIKFITLNNPDACVGVNASLLPTQNDTLFAALELLSGKVMGVCSKEHKAKAFIAFLTDDTKRKSITHYCRYEMRVRRMPIRAL